MVLRLLGCLRMLKCGLFVRVNNFFGGDSFVSGGGLGEMVSRLEVVFVQNLSGSLVIPELSAWPS